MIKEQSNPNSSMAQSLHVVSTHVAMEKLNQIFFSKLMNRDIFPGKKSNLSFLLQHMHVSCPNTSLEVLNIECKIGKLLHFEHF